MPDIPPELMKMMGGAGGPPPSGAQGGAMPPVSAPMSTPQPNEGEKQGAKVKVQMAMDLLEQTLPDFGSESEEGQAVLSVLQGLSKKFGATRDKNKELVPSEIMNLLQALPKGPGGMPPPPGMPGQGAPKPPMPGAPGLM